MAGFTFVQRAQAIGTGFTHSCAFGGPVTAGNLLIVGGTGFATVPEFSAPFGNPVTDTVGNTYLYGAISNAPNATWAAIWYVVSAGSGSNTVTLSSGGANQSFELEEWSFTGSLSVATSSAAAMSAGSISFSGVGLAVGMLCTLDGGGLMPAPGSGYSAGLRIANTTSQCQCSCFEYQNGVTGSANPNWTISGGGTGPQSVGVVFSVPAVTPSYGAALLAGYG